MPAEDVIQAIVSEVVDSSAGLYTIQWRGLLMPARALFPSINTYSAGESIVAERIGASNEWVIVGKIA